jgi:hypothetical protein
MAKSIPVSLRQHRRQWGAAMVEFVVVGPILTVMGLAILQYALMFVAKNQMNYATFMAARAGSVEHANRGVMQLAYAKALIPMYGGGSNALELQESYIRAMKDIAFREVFFATDTLQEIEKKYQNAVTLGTGSLRIELLNPRRQSYDDFAWKGSTPYAIDGKRAIPNAGQAFAYPLTDTVNVNSGQTLQDANLIKLRITHGYTPKVWMMKQIYKVYLDWLDTGQDDTPTAVNFPNGFHTTLVKAGLLPVLSYVTLEMQSDPIEEDGYVPWYEKGRGNDGKPVDPGAPWDSNKPAPQCLTAGCTVVLAPYVSLP